MIPPPVAGAVAVRFDDSASFRLANALDTLANELDRVRRSYEAQRSDVTVDWRGCSRRWFDERHLSLADDLTRAAVAARTDAAAVRQAAASAALQQQERNVVAVRTAASRLEAARSEVVRAGLLDAARLAAAAERARLRPAS